MGYKPKRHVNGHWQSVLPILDSLWAKPPQTLVPLCCVSKSGVCANQERLHFVAMWDKGASEGRFNIQGLQL